MNIQSTILERFPLASKTQLEAAEAFYHELIRGNADQNLTRLTSEEAFVEGHFRDCWELLNGFSDTLGSSVVDLGSGGGVPGLLSAAIEGPVRKWLLIDSERQKVAFLDETIKKLSLVPFVSAEWGRGEAILTQLDAPAVVISRAVGSISKIYSWIKHCSTWNTLILFKGKSWDEEWSQLSKNEKDKISVTRKHEYKNAAGIYRVIIQIHRVPRGTKKL